MKRARARRRAPFRMRQATALALVVAALVVLVGGLLVRHRSISRAAAQGDSAGLSLPDPPAPEERALLARVASARSGDPMPARLLGGYYAGAARPFAALWAYSLALQAQPADIPATLGLARALGQTFFLDDAIAQLRLLLARQPGQPRLVAQLAGLYLRTGRPEAALAVVRGAGPAFVRSKAGAVLEGRVRQALGDAPGAKTAYERAIEQDPRDAGLQDRIGRLALSQGEITVARQAFGAARRLAPANPRYAVELGQALAASPRRDDWLRAQDLYAEALRRDPHYGPAHDAAGVWFLQRSRWREAIEQLQIATDLNPADADAHEHLAQALEATGRAAEAHRHRGLAAWDRALRVPALQEFQAWAALDPDNPRAALQLAQTYAGISRASAARALLEQTRRRFPRDTVVRERLIAMDLLAQEPARARQLGEEWLREEPGSARVFWLLGRIAAAQQHSEEAVRFSEQALAHEPDNPQCLGALGEDLLLIPGTKEVPRAVAALTRAAARMPDDPGWSVALAEGLQRLGRVDEARRQALRALDLDPQQIQAYNLVVQCARRSAAAGSMPGALHPTAGAGSAPEGEGPSSLYARLLRTVEARQRDEQPLWLATWEHPRDPAAYAALARFLIGTGHLVDAEGQLTEALRLRPGWPEVQARLTMIHRLRDVF